MDNVRCMLLDVNLTPTIWLYTAHYAVLVYNNHPHSVLDKHKFRNSVSSVAFVMLFNYQNFYISWRKDHQKDILGIDPAGYKVLDIRSQVA